jgi:hypothetical protein
MAIQALIGPALMGLSGLAGLFGGRQQEQESFGQREGQTDYGSSQTGYTSGETAPQYDPFTMAIRNYLLQQFGKQQQTDLSGYAGQGLSQINAAAGIREQALKNVLAARGLSNSAVAGSALGGIQSQRIGEGVNFLNQIPLMQRQFKIEDLNNFANFFKALPVGQRSYAQTGQQVTGTSHTNEFNKQKQTIPGNMMGGLFSGLGSGLATWRGR